MKKIFIIAGEKSGDLLASKIVKNLTKINKNLELLGIAGEHLQNAGVKTIFPQEELSIMGFVEIIPKIPHILKRIHETVTTIEKWKPDIVITVDSPDFCFRVAKKLKKNGFGKKLIHIVAPTVWAYREKRAKKISKIYDKLLVLYPFEPPYFEKYGLETKFIGHPLVYDKPNLPTEKIIFEKYNLSNKQKIITLTMGSRTKEIEILAPIYLEAINQSKLPKNTIFVIASFEKYQEYFTKWQEKLKYPTLFITDEKEKYFFYKNSYFIIAKSGTNNLEIAKYKTPFVICYKINLITYLILKTMVKTKLVNLINILAKKEIIPELIQYKCTAKNIKQHLEESLNNPKNLSNRLEKQNKFIDKFINKTQDPTVLASDEIYSKEKT